jgi:protein gp37
LIGPVPSLALDGLQWVVVGGESGRGSRPMKLAWAREVVAKARAAGAAIFVKQLGSVWGQPRGDDKGKDFESWPTDLRIRKYPA